MTAERPGSDVERPTDEDLDVEGPNESAPGHDMPPAPDSPPDAGGDPDAPNESAPGDHSPPD